MKTRNVLLSSLLFISFSLFAQTHSKQTLPLCQAFDVLIKSAANNFTDLYGEAIGKSDSKTFNSLVEIAGAKSSIVTGYLDYFSFRADFGTFATSEQVTSYLKNLQSEFIKCKPDFAFLYDKDRVIPEYISNFYFIDKHSAGLKLYNAYFHIRKDNNQYNLKFEIFKKDLLREYIYLTNEPNFNQQECKEVRGIVEASKDKFDRIKGEKSNNGYIEWYNSILCITGLKECRIWPVNAFHKIPTFEVNTGTTNNKDQAKQLKENVTQLIAQSLGKRYAIGSANDGDLITFCLKDDAGKYGKELISIETKSSDKLNSFMKKEISYSVVLSFFTVNP